MSPTCNIAAVVLLSILVSCQAEWFCYNDNGEEKKFEGDAIETTESYHCISKAYPISEESNSFELTTTGIVTAGVSSEDGIKKFKGFFFDGDLVDGQSTCLVRDFGEKIGSTKIFIKKTSEHLSIYYAQPRLPLGIAYSVDMNSDFNPQLFPAVTLNGAVKATIAISKIDFPEESELKRSERILSGKYEPYEVHQGDGQPSVDCNNQKIVLKSLRNNSPVSREDGDDEIIYVVYRKKDLGFLQCQNKEWSFSPIPFEGVMSECIKHIQDVLKDIQTFSRIDENNVEVVAKSGTSFKGKLVEKKDPKTITKNLLKGK